MRGLLLGLTLRLTSAGLAHSQSAHEVCLRVLGQMLMAGQTTQDDAASMYGRCRHLLDTRPEFMAPFNGSQAGRPAPIIPGPLGHALRSMGDGMRGFGQVFRRFAATDAADAPHDVLQSQPAQCHSRADSLSLTTLGTSGHI